jgi:hypothetical protein
MGLERSGTWSLCPYSARPSSRSWGATAVNNRKEIISYTCYGREMIGLNTQAYCRSGQVKSDSEKKISREKRVRGSGMLGLIEKAAPAESCLRKCGVSH